MSVKLKTASNGSVTLSPEDTASDVVLTVPAVAGEILNDQSDIAAAKLTGDVAAARITDALNATGSAPIYACRCWVNFNGTGTVAIRASGNVSSITDNGTGNYTVNFTTAFEDVNYSAVYGRTVDASAYPGGGFVNIATYTTTSVQMTPQRDTSGVNVDSAIVTVAIFR
jgi:uncharacterized protein (AIM24 family)